MMRVMALRRVVMVLAVVVGLLAVFVSGAGAFPPALDAFGPDGDQHVAFPVFHSAQHLPPTTSVVDVGDVDGDAADDVALILDSWDSESTPAVWITSAASPPRSEAGKPGWRGWRIISGGFTGAMAGLGDVNGDGIGEVAVAVRYGEIDVVFGRADGATVDLRDLGDDGFRIIDPDVLLGDGGGGNSCCGVITGNARIVSAGDQNGDGRPDLAWATDSGATVAYTPATPAGATVDATALGSGGFRLAAGALPGTDVTTVGNLGDLDGDGRDDLALAWTERLGVPGPLAGSDSYAAAAASPGPGVSVDLRTAPAAGTGFLLRDANSFLEYATTIGDRNGDGRSDLILARVQDSPLGSRDGLVAYTPPLGSVRELHPLDPTFGQAEPLNSSTVFDAGDQDGDGVTDVGQPQGVRHSSAPVVSDSYLSAPAHGGVAYVANGFLVGSVADRNGDGRRELLVARADPWDDETPGAYAAGWRLETYLSAPVPVAGPIQPPLLSGQGGSFAASFTLAPAPGVTALPAQAGVEVSFPGGFVLDQRDQTVYDATAGRIDVAIPVSSPREHPFVEGETYTYRSYLETSRGAVAWSAPGSFVFHSASTPGGLFAPHSAPAQPAGAAGKAPPAPARGRHVLLGTGRRDVLVGTPQADVLRGLAGDDELRGRRGADRLEGGSGRDRLVGGPGRDVVLGGTGEDDIDVRDGQRDTVRCGAGRDRVRADRNDRVSGCERIRRS
jgi:hypothetical protein